MYKAESEKAEVSVRQQTGGLNYEIKWKTDSIDRLGIYVYLYVLADV